MIENASVALQRQYHRFLAYHCFRSGLSPNNAYTAMIPVYGEGFLHLNNFKRHYTTFRKDDFAIDTLLEPEEKVKRKKKKRVMREKPRPLPLPLPGGGIPPPLEAAGEGQEAPGSVEQAESESDEEDDDDDADMSGGDVDLNEDDSNDVEIIDLEKEEEENERNKPQEDDDDDSQDSVIIISDHGHHYETFHDSSSSHTADKEAENEGNAARQSGDDTPNDDDGDSGASSSEGDSSDEEEVEATQPEEEAPEAVESTKSAPKAKAAPKPKTKPATNVPCRPKLTNKQNRTLILDCFKANYSLRETQRSIRSAYGNAAYSGRAIRKWYERFQGGDLSLKELSRSVKGRLKLKPETLQPILEQTPTISTKALAKQLDCCPRSIVKALFRLGYQFLVNKWVKVLEPTVGPREQQKKIVVSDAELRQYKADHPDATIADFALHFKIPRLKLGSRLRDLGFYYPKWPKRAPPIPGRKPGRPKREEATFVEPENPEERASYIRKTRYGPLRTVYSFVAQAGPSESGPSKPRSKEKADGIGGAGDLLQEAVSFSHALSPGTSGLTAHSTPHNTRASSLRRKPNTSNEAQPPTDTYPLNTSQIFPPMYHYPTASSSSTSSSVASHYNPIGSHLGGGSGGVGSGVTAQHANYFGSYLNAPSDHPQQQQQQQQHLDSSHLLDLFGSLNVPLEATTQQRTHYHHSADGRY